MILLLALALAADGRVDARNWRDHPQIVAVRTVVQEVDAGLQDKAWSKKEKDSPCAGLAANGTLWRDAQRRNRRYVASFGSGDSAYTVTATYDQNGTLRFVLVKAGAVNGSSIEQRTWFDESGAVLWQRDDAQKGPGYSWWRYDPKSKRLADPSKAFAAGACLWE